MARQNHLTKDDFQRILDNYFGRNTGHIVRTKTLDNISGRERFSEAAEVQIYCSCTRLAQKWVFDKAAQIEGGDAKLLAKYEDSVTKDDLIVMDGVKYIVKDLINVPGVYNTDGSVELIYTYANLFIWEND